jgi:hypothetical protein
MARVAISRGIKAENLLQSMLQTWKVIDQKYFDTLDSETRQHSYDAVMSRAKLRNVPIWMTVPEYYEQVASTHRKALLVKQYDHYHQFGWPEDTGEAPTEYEYLWPIEIRKE